MKCGHATTASAVILKITLSLRFCPKDSTCAQKILPAGCDTLHPLQRDAEACPIEGWLGDLQGMRRQDASAELDPLAKSMDQGEAPMLLTSASPQRVPQQRAPKAAPAMSSLATTPMLLSSSGTGMMTVVKTHFVPLGDSLSDSDSDSEVCSAV